MLGNMQKLARAMALFGGVVLSFLVILICLSVAGRGISTFAHWETIQSLLPKLSAGLINTKVGPIPGDFEIVEAGIAFAIFSFLPLCQLHAGHASVDIFTSFLPKQTNAWLTAFGDVCLTSLIILITWRLLEGTWDKYQNGETTFILRFPVWWAYLASVIAAFIASIVALYSAIARVMEATTGRKMTPEGDEGAVH